MKTLALLFLATLAHAQSPVTRTTCAIFDRDGTPLFFASGRLSPGHASCTGNVGPGTRVAFTSASTGWLYSCDGTLPSVWSETIDAQGHVALVCQR